MRVLWFTNTSSCYDDNHPTFGGGWIAELEKLVRGAPLVSLGVAFFHLSDGEKTIRNDVTYYPILRKSVWRNPMGVVWKKWRGDIGDENLSQLRSIIDDFRPDLIHVFGTEGLFSSIQHHTSIPVIVHLQGLMNPIANAFFAPGFSPTDVLLNFRFLKQNLLGNSLYFQYRRVKNQAKREERNLSVTQYVMGRTSWDRQIAMYYQPRIQYFHVDEVLREAFMRPLQLEEQRQLVISSTISCVSYKGIDVILKAARLLAEKKVDFQWKLIGIAENDDVYRFFERKTGIKGSRVNLCCLGAKSSTELASILCTSTIFVHASYIDNSPNSICEAQMVGLPVVACDTGGVSSLVRDNFSGCLVPANGVYELYTSILKLYREPEFMKEIGSNARYEAIKRHDRNTILNSVITSYQKILKQQP